MKNKLDFTIRVISILSLFYVGGVLLLTPWKANILHYVFVGMMCCAIFYEWIKDQPTN